MTFRPLTTPTRRLHLLSRASSRWLHRSDGMKSPLYYVIGHSTSPVCVFPLKQRYLHLRLQCDFFVNIFLSFTFPIRIQSAFRLARIYPNVCVFGIRQPPASQPERYRESCSLRFTDKPPPKKSSSSPLLLLRQIDL